MKKILIVLFVAIVCALSCNDNGEDDTESVEPTRELSVDSTGNLVDTTSN